jgi:hypothetical protein
MGAQANLYKILVLASALTLLLVGLQDLVQRARRQLPIIAIKSVVQLLLGMFMFYFYFTVMHGQ